MKLNKSRLVLSVGSCAILIGALSGCTAGVALFQETRDFIWVGDVNYREKNYAAADYLASVTTEVISKKTLLVPMPLMHANNSGITSPFGEYVTREVGERFAQLGYTVHLPIAPNPARSAAGGTYPVAIPAQNAGVAIDGTYEPDGSEAHIKLRLINRQTGQILGAYDYTLPISGDMWDKIEEKPTVFRTR